MSRVSINDLMPEFTYDTPFENNLSFNTAVNQTEGKTALIFLRYYGCPICQLDLHTYAEGYDKIKAAGGQLLVVLQSDPAGLAAQLQPDTFPYPIICDPEKKLYEMLSITPAPSMMRMMSLSALKKVIKSTAAGYKHGAYEGDEQQLPAAFVMTPDRKLTYVHYGKDAGDVPTVDQLAALLK